MSSVPVLVIGVDCATNPARVGLARGTVAGVRVEIEDVRLGTRATPPLDVVAEWVGQASGPVLLALDAPLGWPAPLGEALAGHRAGDAIDASAHALFRRATDRDVKARLGKQPLDVGADRIARTARAALGLLGELRERLGLPIPLVWQSDVEGVGAVEVYPAATLRAYGVDATGYKRSDGDAARARVVRALRGHLDVPDLPVLIENDDALDAVVCVLAGADVVRGQARGPSDRAVAEREGWIWVRDPV